MKYAPDIQRMEFVKNAEGKCYSLAIPMICYAKEENISKTIIDNK